MGRKQNYADGSHTVQVTAGSNGKIEFVGDVEDNTNGPFYLELDNVSVKEKITVDYKYDYAGRRVKKTVGATVTKYCYDGAQVIAEYEGDTLVRKFIYGLGIDEPIMMIDVDGETETPYYYHFDGLGSVVALSDSAGNIKETYEYDVFGEPTIKDSNDVIISESNYDNPYMFTARRYDNESGLYYYRLRHYSPDIGRFLQVDPIASDLNLYRYCFNDPINWIDPYGLCKEGKGGSSNSAKALTALTATVVLVVDDTTVIGVINDVLIPVTATIATYYGVKAIVDRFASRSRDLPTESKPDSSQAKDRGNGKGQIRDYGPDGKAKTDYDFGHDHGKGDPHAHDWDWIKKPPRQPGRPLKPGE